MSSTRSTASRLLPLILLLLVAALTLAGIVDHDLWTPDEPRVCCIAKTMWQTRDWAVPRLAGEIFLEKPPLYLWLCGACGHLFEPLFGYVGAARLSCTLCALGTLAATAWLGWLLRGRRRDALVSVLVLSTMPLFLLDMHRMRTDVLLAFTVSATVLGYQNPEDPRDPRNGFVTGIRCIRMELGEPDAKGRRRPVPVKDSEFDLDVDTVVIAIGTSPNPLIKNTTAGLSVNDHGGIIVNEEGLTSRTAVFAGGDAVTGAATVISAMGAGKVAAKAIDDYLSKA